MIYLKTKLRTYRIHIQVEYSIWGVGQCTIEYWLGPLGPANCPGAPSTLALLNHITQYRDVVDQKTTYLSCTQDLTVTLGALAGTGLVSRHHLPMLLSCRVHLQQHCVAEFLRELEGGGGVDSNRQKLPPSIHWCSSLAHCCSPILPLLELCWETSILCLWG